jgi:hypothetical protein
MGPKMGPKTDQRRTKDGPNIKTIKSVLKCDGPKTEKRRTKDGKRRTKDGPKTEKRGPKTGKNGPKMDEIRTKDRDQRRTKAGLNHGPKADLMFFLV